jgi:hypothetical protein
MKAETRLTVMFAGWVMAFSGVRRRSWPGTMIAMVGLALAQAAMTIGKSEAA